MSEPVEATTVDGDAVPATGSVEVGLRVGHVPTDPFMWHVLGGVSVAWHPAEILAVEAAASFFPDFGQHQWKPRLDRLVNEERVQPLVTRPRWSAGGVIVVSPLTLAPPGDGTWTLDVRIAAGLGVVGTWDDLRPRQIQCEDLCWSPEDGQTHPAASGGAGVRLRTGPRLSLTLDARWQVWTETFDGGDRVLQHPVAVLGTVSWFVPLPRDGS